MWGLPGPFPAEHKAHGVVLIIAFDTHRSGTVNSAYALFVCDDGRLRYDNIESLTVDWRFDWTTHTWEDVSIGESDDQTSDRSPEVPGDLPEPPGADRSDSGDEGDATSGGLVPE